MVKSQCSQSARRPKFSAQRALDVKGMHVRVDCIVRGITATRRRRFQDDRKEGTVNLTVWFGLVKGSLPYQTIIFLEPYQDIPNLIYEARAQSGGQKVNIKVSTKIKNRWILKKITTSFDLRDDERFFLLILKRSFIRYPIKFPRTHVIVVVLLLRIGIYR